MTIITLLFYAVVIFCLLRIVCLLVELLEIKQREEYRQTSNNEFDRLYTSVTEVESTLKRQEKRDEHERDNPR